VARPKTSDDVASAEHSVGDTEAEETGTFLHADSPIESRPSAFLKRRRGESQIPVLCLVMYSQFLGGQADPVYMLTNALLDGSDDGLTWK
jgi:hypothetical protein